MKKTDICIVCTLLFPAFFQSCRDGAHDYSATGIFEAVEVTVSAETSGRIESLNFSEGEDVSSGDILCLVDTTQLHLSKMQLMAANEAITSRMVDVDLQMSATRKQLSTMKNEYDRYRSLLASGAVSQKQVDDIQSQISVLESQLEAQEANLSSANESLSGESLSSYIQIQQINDRISRSMPRSPISGRIISRYVEAGELAAEGRPLFKIADTRNMYIRVYFTSDQLHSIKVGDKVSVFADYGGDKLTEYQGTITWISEKSEFTPKTIYTSNERANLVYAAKVSFENDGYAKIGMYGGIKLHN